MLCAALPSVSPYSSHTSPRSGTETSGPGVTGSGCNAIGRAEGCDDGNIVMLGGLFMAQNHNHNRVKVSGTEKYLFLPPVPNSLPVVVLSEVSCVELVGQMCAPE